MEEEDRSGECGGGALRHEKQSYVGSVSNIVFLALAFSSLIFPSAVCSSQCRRTRVLLRILDAWGRNFHRGGEFNL